MTTAPRAGRVILALAASLATRAPAPQAAAAQWPEELGRARGAGAASEDPAPEARAYLAALSFLEPGFGHDAAVATGELAALAAGDGEWADRARYALAWLAEHQGAAERAEGGYARLAADEASGPTGARARVGLARLLLRRGEAGRAAGWIQEAIDAEPVLAAEAAPWRALALGRLREARGGGVDAAGLPVPGKSFVGLAVTSRGAFLADRPERSSGRVRLVDARGAEVDAWTLPGLEALTADTGGRVFAAAQGTIYRLDPGGLAVVRARAGALGPLAALAAEPSGRLWALEDRGRRVGCVAAGGQEAEVCLEVGPARLAALVWDGARLIAIDERRRELVVLPEPRPDGLVRAGPRVLASVPGACPSCLAVDGTGRLAWLDRRAGRLRLLRPDGGTQGERDLAPATAAGLDRLAYGPDGTLHGLDAAAQAWVRWP